MVGIYVQKGIHVDSDGFGPEIRSDFDAGRIYTFPDLARQTTLSPLLLVADKMIYLMATRIIFFPLRVGSGRKVCE